MLPRSEEIKDLALKFSKQQLSGLAQRGEIDPMTAVMAGMMRDRIVSEEMRQNMPETTVADDVLGAAQQMGQPQGMGQPQDQFAQMRQPVEGQPQMAMMAEGGLASIPVDDGMFDYAGGGIVAFSNGGDTMFTGSPLGQNVRGLAQVSPRTPSILAPGAIFFQYMTDDEKRIYEATGVVPESAKQRYQQQAAKQAVRPPAEDIIAQAQRGEGPNVSRPTAPADIAVVPFDGPAVPRPTGLQTGQQPPPPGPQPGPGPVPGAASAAPGVGSADLMDRLNKAYGVGADGALATLPTGMEDIFKERAEAERLAGVDKDFFKNEARNILDLRRELKADKKDAANMRLIEAGLRIMGGESPYAFVNIGKGASEALKGFADDIKDIQKTKREYDKSERELRTAEQLYAKTQSDSALKTVEERRARNQEQQIKFAEAQNNLQIAMANLDIRREQVDVQREGVKAQAAAAARPSEMERMIRFATDPNTPEAQRKLAQAALAGKTGPKPMSQYERAALQQRAMQNAATELSKNNAYGRLSRSNKPEDQAAAKKMRDDLIADYMARIGGASNLGGATFLGYEE